MTGNPYPTEKNRMRREDLTKLQFSIGPHEYKPFSEVVSTY